MRIFLIISLSLSILSFYGCKEIDNALYEKRGNEVAKLIHSGQYERAQYKAEKNLKSVEKTFGPDDYRTVDAMTDYAFILTINGHYQDAKDLLLKGIEIEKRESQYPRPKGALVNLGVIYEIEGNESKAKEAYNEAIYYIKDPYLKLKDPSREETPFLKDELKIYINWYHELNFDVKMEPLKDELKKYE